MLYWKKTYESEEAKWFSKYPAGVKTWAKIIFPLSVIVLYLFGSLNPFDEGIQKLLM